MNEKFNQLIVNILWKFIKDNHFNFSSTKQVRKYTFYKNKHVNSHVTSYSREAINDIMSFNIFEPISQFSYGKGKLYLMTFTDSINNDFFNLCKHEFMHTIYEDLFLSTITKIIPINYCIEQQNWDIVKKLLTIKHYKSNGLPDMEHCKLFFQHLKDYIHFPDFNDHLFIFLNQQKTLIKRHECQQYLKKLLSFITDTEKFSQFIDQDKHTFISYNNDYITCRLYKPFLFSKFSDFVVDKKEATFKFTHFVQLLKTDLVINNHIKDLFVVQEEEKFKELIIFIHFSQPINYCFEDYLMFLFKSYLENQLHCLDSLKKVSQFYFMNKKLLPLKHKHTITKI